VGKQDNTAAIKVGIESSRQDKLIYLSDMIKELTAISDQLECATLTGLLEVASREADIQSRRLHDGRT